MPEARSDVSMPLRIAVVSETFPPEVNGVAMTLGRLVDGLRRRGHEVQVVRPAQGPGDKRIACPEESLVKGVPIPNYGGLRFGLPSSRRLQSQWQGCRPDLVHVATEGPLGWSAVSAALKLGIPVTSSFHTNFDTYTAHYGLGLLKAPVESYLRKMHNRTLLTLAPTRTLAGQLTQRGFRQVGVMARGVALNQFHPRHRDPVLRRAWGLAPESLAVLYVGRLAREKNFGPVIGAFEGIRKHRSDARLVFVGDGPMRHELQAICPDAIFAGIQQGEKLATCYASGDLFLFSSLSETYGNVVPEALASGLAVLAYDQAAAAELIRDGVNGALVKPGDEAGFLARALALAMDRQSLEALRKSAAPSVAHLDWDSVIDQFVRSLKEVLSRAGHGVAVTEPRLAIE